jgi:hypothetical protein
MFDYMTSTCEVISTLFNLTRIKRWIMVDEFVNLISTLFQCQKTNVDQFAFSIFYQRLSNVWEIISDVDSTLNKRRG